MVAPPSEPTRQPPSADAASVTLVTDRADLDALSAPWEELRQRAEASPFLGPTLYRAWLEELGGSSTPRLVAVESAGRLVALAPWARRGPLAFSVPGRTRVAGELLAEPAVATVAWRLVLDAALGGRVAAVLVPHATDDELGIEGALAAAAELGLPARAAPRYKRFRLRPEGTYEDHLATWTKDRRRVVTRTRKRLEAQGELRFRAVPAAEGYDAVRAIHIRQWTPEETIEWVHTDAGTRIDRRLVAALDSTVLLLELDGRPLAGALWFDTGGTRTCVYLVRDPDVTSGSPGRLMHAEIVRRAYEDGVRRMDWMGIGGRKEVLGIEEHVGYELLVGARGPLGRGAVALRGAEQRLRARG